MFKEQLHSSFDEISPSPELLDRISAMMNEEVNRQKPPLRMKVTRYAGIAAAVAIAAGGTFALVQSQNGGRSVSVSNDASMAAPENYSQQYLSGGAAETRAAGDMQTTAAAAAVQEETYGAGTAYETTTEAPSEAAADEEAQDMDGVSLYAIMSDDEEPAGEAPAAGDVPAGAAAKAPENNADGEEAAEEAAPASGDNAPNTNDNATAVTAAPAAMAAEEATEEVAEEVAEEEEADEEAMPEASLYSESSDDDENPGGGEGLTYIYEHPFYPEFFEIPDELAALAPSEKLGAYYSEFDTGYSNIHSVDDGVNILTFIRYFDIPEAEARDAIIKSRDGTIAALYIDTLFSGDSKAVTAAFATEWAVITDSGKVYSPRWLYEHTLDEWRAEGITKDNVAARPEVWAVWMAGNDIMEALNKKLTEFTNS